MPSYLTAALRNESFRFSAQSLHPQLGLRSSAWPVNEIVLQSLILSGKNSGQIADMFGVSMEEVSGLRQAYDL